jgi:NAD(P)-dependent dehydrogenase (short-subunit alcohol dehydrogenase family)
MKRDNAATLQWPQAPVRVDRRGSLNPRIESWAGRRVWLVGASSGIGAALADALARLGARLALSARSETALEGLRQGFPEEARGTTLVLPVDVNDHAALRAATDRIGQSWGGVDLVVWLAGTYRPMRADQFDLGVANEMLQTNLGAMFKGLDCVLPMLLAQRAGGLAIVSSVAGYRGLPKALAYGPTKAALINLAESLYLDLSPEGIGVWLIDPGFVETPLTAQNTFRMPGLIDARTAADQIIRGLAGGGFEIHFPRRFTLWMKFLSLLPARLYFRLVRMATGL